MVTDGVQFANSFGRILKFNSAITSLATAVLSEMHSQFPSTTDKHGPLYDYFGVHLRTESDGLYWWPDATTQEREALDRIKLHDPEYVYVATTDVDSAARFAAMVDEQTSAKMLNKTMLLKGKQLDELTAMTWDQQGMVDYLVLLLSRHFVAMSSSSFAMNLAIRRHLLDKGVDTLLWRGMNDSRTFLHGPRQSYKRNWIYFIEAAMWP